ncbi:MAG: cytochrome c maturation protein CcmE [Porticoccaceae bacterium]
MRPVRKKRLQLVIFMMIGAAIVIGLDTVCPETDINLFFYPKTDSCGRSARRSTNSCRGLVVDGSVERATDSLYVEFVITDTVDQVRVAYDGILPDLFREGQGTIAIGRLDEAGVVQASEVLAKHDENYMSPEIQKAIERPAILELCLEITDLKTYGNPSGAGRCQMDAALSGLGQTSGRYWRGAGRCHCREGS